MSYKLNPTFSSELVASTLSTKEVILGTTSRPSLTRRREHTVLICCWEWSMSTCSEVRSFLPRGRRPLVSLVPRLIPQAFIAPAFHTASDKSLGTRLAFSHVLFLPNFPVRVLGRPLDCCTSLSKWVHASPPHTHKPCILCLTLPPPPPPPPPPLIKYPLPHLHCCTSLSNSLTLLSLFFCSCSSGLQWGGKPMELDQL